MTILLQSATGITKCDDYYKVRQYKPLQQYYHVVVFIQYVVLTFDHSIETSKKNGLSVRNIGNTRVFILCCFVITVHIVIFPVLL